jgi:hypothetical protein
MRSNYFFLKGKNIKKEEEDEFYINQHIINDPLPEY